MAEFKRTTGGDAFSVEKSKERAAAQKKWTEAEGHVKAAYDLIREKPANIDLALEMLEEARVECMTAFEAYMALLREAEKPPEVVDAYNGAMECLAGQAEVAARTGDAEQLHAVADQIEDLEEKFDEDERVLSEEEVAEGDAELRTRQIKEDDHVRWMRRLKVLRGKTGVFADAMGLLRKELDAPKPKLLAPAPWAGWENPR